MFVLNLLLSETFSHISVFVCVFFIWQMSDNCDITDYVCVWIWNSCVTIFKINLIKNDNISRLAAVNQTAEQNNNPSGFAAGYSFWSSVTSQLQVTADL